MTARPPRDRPRRDWTPPPVTMKAPRLRAAAALRAGFTLIELLAVFLIIGILGAALYPQLTAVIGTSKTGACEQNLAKIGVGFTNHATSNEGDWPNASGVKFFASLIARRTWEATPQNAKRLTCPGVSWKKLGPYLDGETAIEEWFTRANFDNLDGSYSTYAAVDLKRAAGSMRKFPASGNVVIMADDNDTDDGTGNHETGTNMLMGNLSTRRLELLDLMDSGELADDESVRSIPVGPDSPIEMLQKLSLD